MKRVHFPFLILLAMSIQLARSAEVPAVIDRPQAEPGPTRVSVGIWMADITNIDSAQQNFTAEVAVVLRWRDPRLTHTGNGIVRYPLEQVWHPRVAVVNETPALPAGAVNPGTRFAGPIVGARSPLKSHCTTFKPVATGGASRNRPTAPISARR